MERVAAFVFADIGCPKFLAYFVALVQSAVHPPPECTDTQYRQLLADVFALYLKTKNFHWHVPGRHFREHHLLLRGPTEK
jgi:hypothetical protein